jgi:hypothetical protein
MIATNDLIKYGLIALAIFVLYYLFTSNKGNAVVKNSGEMEMEAEAEAEAEAAHSEEMMKKAAEEEEMAAIHAMGGPGAPGVAGPSEVAVEDRAGPIGAYPISPVGAEYNEKIIAGDPRTSYCFPKDQLQSDQLLPTDSASTWAQFNPHGEGYLKNRNFLNAGYHIGINTQGQSLRNANLQIRSEPPNPQVVVSPWTNSSIGPDTNRLPLEIGESCY